MFKLLTAVLITLLVQLPANAQSHQRGQPQRPQQAPAVSERHNTGLTTRERVELHRDVGRISREIYVERPKRAR
jgi:hypothetical protein